MCLYVSTYISRGVSRELRSCCVGGFMWFTHLLNVYILGCFAWKYTFWLFSGSAIWRIDWLIDWVGFYCRHLRPSYLIIWWMKLRRHLPPGHDAPLLSISVTGSFICPVAQTRLDIPIPLIRQWRPLKSFCRTSMIPSSSLSFRHHHCCKPYCFLVSEPDRTVNLPSTIIIGRSQVTAYPQNTNGLTGRRQPGNRTKH